MLALEHEIVAELPVEPFHLRVTAEEQQPRAVMPFRIHVPACAVVEPTATWADAALKYVYIHGSISMSYCIDQARL
jgi:hypothetical protein